MRSLKPIIFSAISLLLLASCSTTGGGTEREEGYGKGQKIIQGSFEKFYQKYDSAVHRLGGEGPDAFDCSGFVQRAFRDIYGIKLHRTSGSQFQQGMPVKKIEHLRYGDLVFFNTSGKGVSHVGIYLYNNEFIHVSTSLGVTKTDINSDYYRPRFIEGRRILQ